MEITKQQIQKIIELAGAEFFPENVDSIILSRLLVTIEQKMNFFDIPIELNSKQNIKVLVVDDLELSIYQLIKVLRKIGLTPFTARTKEEAIAEMKKNSFDYIVADLYLPDLQDGQELLNEIEKLKNTGNYNCHVILISSTDKEEIIDMISCKVDKYIPKNDKWHEEILKYIAQNLPKNGNVSENFSKYFIDSNTAVFIPVKINTQTYINEFISDFNITMTQGIKNIIINFEKINFFDSENANLFTELYKIAATHDGEMIIVNINNTIKGILEDIFIDDIIKTTTSVDEAVKLFSKKEEN